MADWSTTVTVGSAAVAAVAALATVWQTRAGGRERRVADVAEAVGDLDSPDPTHASRGRLKATLIPVLDALPICRLLATADAWTIRRWAEADLPGAASGEALARIARTLVLAAEEEVEAALHQAAWRWPFRHRRLDPSVTTAGLRSARNILAERDLRIRELQEERNAAHRSGAREDYERLVDELAPLEDEVRSGVIVVRAARALFDETRHAAHTRLSEQARRSVLGMVGRT